MRRWMTRTLAALSAVGLLVSGAGAVYQAAATRRDVARTPPPGQLVDVGGHRLHIRCIGEGTPAVILEAGLGGSTVDWGFVQPEAARFTRVCAYDRAGLGYSDPGPPPRTARRLATELALLLDRAGIGGPVVLAGASFGGFPVRILASEPGNRVAGLVLVDASHEDQPHEIPTIAPFVPFLASVGAFRVADISFGLPSGLLAPAVREVADATRFRASAYQAAASEIAHMTESAVEVRDARRELRIPLIVLTAGRADAAWRNLQRDQARQSRRGCQIVAEQSGHLIVVDEPDVVIRAIRAVVDAARGQDAAGSACPPVERRNVATVHRRGRPAYS
jgi:pimeloyl-ACP methyl ester carboxylesterase